MLILAMSVAALAGCTADMDKFTERLDDLEARVAALETLCDSLRPDERGYLFDADSHLGPRGRSVHY